MSSFRPAVPATPEGLLEPAVSRSRGCRHCVSFRTVPRPCPPCPTTSSAPSRRERWTCRLLSRPMRGHAPASSAGMIPSVSANSRKAASTSESSAEGYSALPTDPDWRAQGRCRVVEPGQIELASRIWPSSSCRKRERMPCDDTGDPIAHGGTAPASTPTSLDSCRQTRRRYRPRSIHLRHTPDESGSNRAARSTARASSPTTRWNSRTM